jgi:hypothetical protein
MVNIEYHKDKLCPIRLIICQEGYCSNCMIYLNENLFNIDSVISKNHKKGLDN